MVSWEAMSLTVPNLQLEDMLMCWSGPASIGELMAPARHAAVALCSAVQMLCWLGL